MKTDHHGLLFFKHVCCIHGDFRFQLAFPNERALVPMPYCHGRNWRTNGPAGALIS